MSANGPHTVEEAALTQQVEAASRECAGLSAALARGRRSRRVFLLLVLLFVVVVALAFFGLYRQVQTEFVDKFPALAQERFEKNSDRYMGEIHTLVDNAGPKVQEAFMEQVKKDMPKYVQRMERERDEFAEALKTKLEKRLKAHYTQLLERQQKTLETEFKDIQDPKKHEQMIANIDRAVQKMVKRYYVDELESQVHELYGTWDAFPAAAAPGPKDPSTVDLLVSELLDWLPYQMSHSRGLAMR